MARYALWYMSTLATLVVAMFVRLPFYDYVSFDFSHFVASWYSQFEKHGRMAIGNRFADYTPLYPYLLGLFHGIAPQITPLYAVKLVSFLGDGLAAAFAWRLTRHTFPQSPRRAVITALAVLFSPMVIANGSMSAQCDIMHSLGMIACFYLMQAGRVKLALVWFGLAMAFKPWTLFIAPYMAIFLLAGVIRWRDIWIPPAVYYATFLPAWLAGRDFYEMVTIYQRNFNRFFIPSYCSVYAANLCSLFQDVWRTPRAQLPAVITGFNILTGVLCLAYTGLGLLAYRRRPFDARQALLLATFITSMVPYTLPYMHERYAFAGNLFAVLLACWMPRYLPAALLANVASWMTYSPHVIPRAYTLYQFPLKFSTIMGYAILFNAIALAMIGYGCWRSIWWPALRQAMPERIKKSFRIRRRS